MTEFSDYCERCGVLRIARPVKRRGSESSIYRFAVCRHMAALDVWWPMRKSLISFDKWQAVFILLNTEDNISNREIATRVGISHPTVSRLRNIFSRNWEDAEFIFVP